MENVFKSFKINVDGTPTEIILDKTFKIDRKDGAVPKRDALFLHFHPYFEFFFVGGDGLEIVTEEGEFSIKNSVVVLPPGFKHYSVSGNGTYRFFAKVDQREGGKDLGSAFFGYLSRAKIHRISKNEGLIFYLSEIEKLLASPSENGRLKLPPLLTLTLLTVADLLHLTLDEADSGSYSKYGEYLFKFENILAAAFTEKIDLGYVASRLYLSKKQVSRIIKRAYGCTLSELITEKRLSAAASLLLTTDKPVSEITEELGFSTESYFFVLFKKRYGVTPLGYRKKQ